MGGYGGDEAASRALLRGRITNSYQVRQLSYESSKGEIHEVSSVVSASVEVEKNRETFRATHFPSQLPL